MVNLKGKQVRKIILIGICCITVMLSGCNKVSVQSSWNDGKIKIDANSKDWGPRLVWNEKNKTGLGVANDADNLYLCLTTSERTLPRLIMMGGFIVKIDQKGAKSHNFGIKFPLGMNGQGFQPMEPPDDMSQEMGQDMRGQERPQSGIRSPQGMRGMNRSGQDNQDNGFMERMNDLQTELMLLGPGKGQETIVPLENDLGLEVKIGRDRQQLVYEIKIPFDLLGEYMQIEQISTTKPLKVNFSTVKIEMPSGGPGGDDMGGGPGGGGMGGPGGGMGGGPDGGMGGGPGGGGMGGPGGGMGNPGSEDSSDQSFSYNISITLAVKQ